MGPAGLLGGHDRHRDGGIRARSRGRHSRRSCAAGPRSAPRRSGPTTRSTRSGCPRCSSPVRCSTSGACGGRAGSSSPRTPSATRGESRSRSCSCRTCSGARRRWRSLLLAAVSLFSALVRAPLGPPANPGLSLNPAKAPWYFLGFQELLVHLHPLFAVVVVPALGALALVALPYLGFAEGRAARGVVSLGERPAHGPARGGRRARGDADPRRRRRGAARRRRSAGRRRRARDPRPPSRGRAPRRRASWATAFCGRGCGATRLEAAQALFVLPRDRVRGPDR